jgi:hypothetical protein
MVDGYDNYHKSMATMESLGLPTGFSLTGGPMSTKQKKGDKKTFYCQICLIELNSLDTMTSHKKGVKHMKKELTLRDERDKRYQMGQITSHEKDDEEQRMSVIAIPNPPSTKQKVLFRLSSLM